MGTESYILLTAFMTVVAGDYFCAQTNGTFQNDEDYRSYYVCTNFCNRLEYCSRNEYYVGSDRVCRSTGFSWVPAYDLNGIQEIKRNLQYRYYRQSNYDVYSVTETQTHQYSFTGRYINETNVIGTETILAFRNKCILLRNVQLSVTESRSFCVTNVANAYSMNCKLPDYMFSGCVTY